MPEYVILEKLKDEIEVARCKPEDAKPFFAEKHYLKKMPAANFFYGVYVKATKQMIGAIAYGPPFPTVSKMLAKLAKPEEILDLKRLFIEDVGIRNVESYVIGQSLKLLQQDDPNLKIVITFADSKEGHVGAIYQATNAVYIGQSGGKHRYLYFFGKDADKMKSMIQAQPYPKKPETQLDKAIAEAESHVPGALRRNFWNFGTLVNDPGRGIKEWRPAGDNMNNWFVNEAYDKKHATNNAVVMMFVWGLNTLGASFLTSSDGEKLIRSNTVIVKPAPGGIVSPKRVQLLVFIPKKLFRASALEEIEDNPIRAGRDIATVIERDLRRHGVEMSLDLTISREIVPEYISIIWDARAPGHVDPDEVDPSKNQ